MIKTSLFGASCWEITLIQLPRRSTFLRVFLVPAVKKHLSEHPDRPPMATGKDVQRPRPEIGIDPPSGLDSRSTAWFLVGEV